MTTSNRTLNAFEQTELGLQRFYQKLISSRVTENTIRIGLRVIYKYQNLPTLIQAIAWLSLGFTFGLAMMVFSI
jgi:hypothetical protein